MVLAKEGDRKAFGRIFRICYKSIYDYIIRRTGNHDDAEDLTMQVFTKGLGAVSSYEERGCSVRGWLFRIAHNGVVDHFRAQVQRADIRDLQDVADEIDIEEGVVSREKLGDLYEKVMSLPQAQSEVLTLRFLEDLSVAETALILGKKEVTVRALQFKGIRNLRDRMGNEPGDNDQMKDEKEKRD